MSLERFVGSRDGAVEPEELMAESSRVLAELTGGREYTDYLLSGGPGVAAAELKHPETECVLRLLQGDWGIFGAGVASVPGEEEARLAKILLLHPLWLAEDIAALQLPSPFIPAVLAEWARPQLEALLHVDLRDYLLQASSPPRPLVASGDATDYYAKKGTLGPRATWYADWTGNVLARDGSEGGSIHDGFVTAGHVTGGSIGTAIDVGDSSGWVYSGTVEEIRAPSAYSTSSAGRAIHGGVDAALISITGASFLTGLGAAGDVAADSVVEKSGAATQLTEGVASSYMVWCGGPSGVWSDCYGIVLSDQQQRQYARFADHGDSGACVIADDSVIGIVVGSALRASGCPQSVTYAQDITTIEIEMNCVISP